MCIHWITKHICKANEHVYSLDNKIHFKAKEHVYSLDNKTHL